MDTKQRILVVDDEETLCEALRFNLETEGYEVSVAHSAEEAMTIDLSHFSLILLDIMMGDLSGTEFAALLKRNRATAEIPIIFCTAKDTVDDMVDGLELGADDYITKPYSIKNLLARVRAVLRRTSPSASSHTPADDSIACKGLRISSGSKCCTIDGKEVKMPRKEFEILTLLMSNPGHIFSRQEILSAIWPEEVIVVDRVVDVNITRLRSKLGAYGSLIVTKTGYGYGFSD